MARLSLILILIMLSVKSFPQTVFRNVIASGGISTTASGYTISSTIGQIPFKTLCEDANALTQGFEQPGVKIIKAPPDNILIYPNPVTDILYLIFSLDGTKDFILNVVDLTGREILTKQLTNIKSAIIYSIDFSQIPDGFYLIHVYEKSNETIFYKVAKIEKLSKTQ